VLLGDARTRGLYLLLLAASVVALAALALDTSAWALLGLVGTVPGARAARLVAAGTSGRRLVPVLQLTGLTELLYAAGILVGLLLG